MMEYMECSTCFTSGNSAVPTYPPLKVSHILRFDTGRDVLAGFALCCRRKVSDVVYYLHVRYVRRLG